MKTNLVKLTLAGAFLASACGGHGANSTSGSGSSNSSDAGSLLLTDTTAAGQAISVQVDTGIGGVAQEVTTSSSGFSLLGDSSSSNQSMRFRQCTVSGSDADVTITQMTQRSYSFMGPRRSYQETYENYYLQDRTWSNASGTVGCDASGKYADVSVPNLAGISLAVTLTDERAKSQQLTNLKTGATSDPGYKYELKGTRNVNWTAVTLAGSTYEITKTVTHNFNSTMQITTKNGDSTTLTTAITTASGTPLNITVDRDQSTLNILQRTVNSGSIEATQTDGTMIQSTFAGVVYSYSANEQCIPTAGQVTGSIFPAGTTTASLTFTISFGDTPSITFSNGDTVDYTPQGCDLDDTAVQAVDEASKSAITPPANVAPATAPAAPAGTTTAT